MSLRTQYDDWHQRVLANNPVFEDASAPWYQLVRETIGDVSGLRILEVACGRGGYVRELTLAGASVTGCDFSHTALRAAIAKLLEAEVPQSAALIQADAQNLPFADDSFDLLVSCETVEHLPDIQRGFHEMHRVTRPGGKLFLTTPNYANFMGLYELYAKFRHPDRKDDQPFDRRQWFAQILSYVRRAGWTNLRTDGTVHQFPFFPGHSPLRMEALEKNRTVRKLLSPFALHYFVMAQKKDIR
jgi:ubiquinone/menaquinone biosynthesis C-methylase UbiE